MLASMLILTASLLGADPGDDELSEGASGGGPVAVLEQLKREMEEDMVGYMLDSKEAEPEEQEKLRAAILERRRARGERALELARNHPHEPVAIDALTWAVGYPILIPEVQEQALQELIQNHIEDAGIGEACLTVHWILDPTAETLLRDVIAKNPHKVARGLATFSLARRMGDHSGRARRLEEGSEGPFDQYSPETKARILSRSSADYHEESERLYESAARDYGDVELHDRFDRVSTLAAMVRGRAFNHERLNVGQEAPEIEGEDADGVRFRLSDYRGTVVLLTFSGNWCGPCRGDYPHERELVERLKDQPFAMVSVNTDPERETLKGSIAKGEITWRCWWDGGTSGPICTKWGIHLFPTTFLIDGDGVIRYRYLRKEKLDEPVESLLKELASRERPEAPSGGPE